MISLDGYAVRKCVHETPYGALYTAQRERDGLEVLLKSYRAERGKDPELRARREYEALRKLSGPGVLCPLEAHLDGRRPVLVLDRVPGMDLGALLETRRLTAAELFDVALQLAETLVRVHAERLIHRAVRPSNVLVDPRTLQTTLLDFTLALTYGSGASGTDGAAMDQRTETLRYAAPEQTGRMDRGVDFRSDLYSLGALLYHAVVGAPPFEGDDPLSLIHAHMARVPVPPLERGAAIPPTLSRIVMKLLQKEPEDRYQTAHALHRDLFESREQLRRTGQIEDDFPLGTADVPVRPLFAKRLYGREAEVEALRSAYERVAGGTVELLLLRGPPGIGKSSLVHELRPLLAKSGAYLASGKFDLYRRDLPYAAFIAAFQSLVHQMLTENEERLARWRTELRAELGNVAGALIELVPDLAAALGELPALPVLGPKETQARLALAVERFVRCCASPEHPLVLFLDDLQWADAGSRYLLEDLVTRGDATALLVIAAYRDNEVEESHPWNALLGRLAGRGIRPVSIAVSPLGADAAAQMLADALGRPLDETRRLAECVMLKTGSAPLLIQHFIHHAQSVGLIRFAAQQGWTWDHAALAAADIPEGAVALMVAKLARLEENPRKLIRFASCVGDRFDSLLLAELTGEPVAALEQSLFALAEEGLLAPCASGFRFVHDRIREAAQALLSAAERSVLHHRAGRLLLERTPPEQLSERSFEIADHLNRGVDRLSDDERPRALEINFLAGSRSLRAGAAATASSYLGFARSLFRPGDWSRDPGLAFELFWSAAEAAYQTKSFELALQLLDALEARPLERLRAAQVVAKRISVLILTPGVDAVAFTLAALRRFGVRWPRHPSRLRAWLVARCTDWMLRGPLDERLFPPERGDRSWIAPVLLLNAGGAALTRQSNRLALLSAARSLRAQVRHGCVRSPSFAFAAYAAFRLSALERSAGTARYAQAALDWMERMPGPASDVRAEWELQVLVFPWILARRKVLEPLRLLVEKAREVGDIEYAGYSLRNRAVYSALCGEPLGKVVRDFETLDQGDPAQSGAFFHAGYVRAYRLLHGEDADGAQRWRAELAAVGEQARGLRADAASYLWLHWMVALCFLGEHEAALALGEKIADALFALGAPGSSLCDFTFFRGLAAAALAGRCAGAERRRRLRLARACARRLRKWALHGPDFAHMALFLDAECARVRGEVAPSLRLYEQATRRAREQGYRHHAALLHERRAELLREKRRESESLLALREALALYQEWGAHGKVSALRARESAQRSRS